MAVHVIPHETHSVELDQIAEINAALARDPAVMPLCAADLGVAGAQVHPHAVDAVVAHRAHLPAHLLDAPVTLDVVAAGDRLVQLVAAGPTTFPYVYGLFGRGGAGEQRLLPLELHTEQLRRISEHLHCRHRWGI